MSYLFILLYVKISIHQSRALNPAGQSIQPSYGTCNFWSPPVKHKRVVSRARWSTTTIHFSFPPTNPSFSRWTNLPLSSITHQILVICFHIAHVCGQLGEWFCWTWDIHWYFPFLFILIYLSTEFFINSVDVLNFLFWNITYIEYKIQTVQLGNILFYCYYLLQGNLG